MASSGLLLVTRALTGLAFEMAPRPPLLKNDVSSFSQKLSLSILVYGLFWLGQSEGYFRSHQDTAMNPHSVKFSPKNLHVEVC